MDEEPSVKRVKRGQVAMWKPTEKLLETSNLTKFMRIINAKYKLAIQPTEYHKLWQWSVENQEQVWAEIWDFVGIISSQPYTKVIEKGSRMQETKFFVGARLNFAENLLKFKDDRIAITFKGEGASKPVHVTYAELYQRVAILAQRMRQMGIRSGDRVAAYIPNLPETVIAMLASTSIGAIYTSCSPDFGKQGVLDRFQQIQPRIVFAADGYFYKGKRIDTLPNLKQIMDEMTGVEKVVVFRHTIDPKFDLNLSSIPNAIYYDAFVAEINGPVRDTIEFEQLPFDHPVYIMYSSGTTGLPKCIVQGCGVLLNHMKEHLLHMNFTRDDRLFYFTTTGWMMWNWLVSGLGIGANIILFDGNPLYPDAGTLWKYAADCRMSLFGTSARYLAAVMDSGCQPGSEYDLSALKVIASTGSPATTNIFNFVYSKIKTDVQFASISGGTDLNGCFALGCSNLPVYDGELQCRGLALDVRVFNDDAQDVIAQKGELVCLQPFPSMPLSFWDDKEGSRYFGAYFDVYPGIWRHGDFAEITERHGMIIYGRSDATLNPGGVRIGTADIYRVADESIPEIADSVVVGQDYKLKDGSPDVRILLFVVLSDGNTLNESLIKTIRQQIRTQVTPRHVPARIIECPEIPYTVSGKKVEIVVKRIMDGMSINNRSALRNPECLDWFVQHAAKELKQ